MQDSLKLAVADCAHSLVRPRTTYAWYMRICVLAFSLIVIAWIASRVHNRDVMIWLGDAWPHYYVDWGNGESGRFPRWKAVLVLGVTVPHFILPLLMIALVPLSAARRGLIVGVDLNVASVFAVWGMLLATWCGVRDLYWTASPYLIVAMFIGAVLSMLYLHRSPNRWADTTMCYASVLIPIAFVWHCMCLPHVMGSAT